LGSGGPAVVFLPGASAVGLDYFGVQQLVSRFTTAAVHDRGARAPATTRSANVREQNRSAADAL
jgi:hypothetical protein